MWSFRLAGGGVPSRPWRPAPQGLYGVSLRCPFVINAAPRPAPLTPPIAAPMIAENDAPSIDPNTTATVAAAIATSATAVPQTIEIMDAFTPPASPPYGVELVTVGTVTTVGADAGCRLRKPKYRAARIETAASIEIAAPGVIALGPDCAWT